MYLCTITYLYLCFPFGYTLGHYCRQRLQHGTVDKKCHDNKDGTRRTRGIAEEMIHQYISRQEYRKVLIPLFNIIRDLIGWVDSQGSRFCPK